MLQQYLHLNNKLKNKQERTYKDNWSSRKLNSCLSTLKIWLISRHSCKHLLVNSKPAIGPVFNNVLPQQLILSLELLVWIHACAIIQ